MAENRRRGDHLGRSRARQGHRPTRDPSGTKCRGVLLGNRSGAFRSIHSRATDCGGLSRASELATAIAFDEASWRGVELIALHAWSDAHVSDIPSIEWSAQQAVGEEALSERLAGWRERYPDVAVRRRIVLDAPARHLLEEAESSQLLVVGSHGRGGFPGMLLGSVSTAVAQAARVPVIVAGQQ